MLLRKNIRLGKNKFHIFFLVLIQFLFFCSNLNSENKLEGKFTNIQVLDKISSKNILLNLENGKETIHKDLIIKSMKCKNSEFDDNPEVTAYMQVQDITFDNNDQVFVFNGWTFSSSPSIQVFDHPVYDLWIQRCY